MGLLLLVSLIVLLLGGLSTSNYNREWVYIPSSGIGLVLAVLIGASGSATAQEDIAAPLKNSFAFSAPEGLNTNFQTDSGSDARPSIATDGAGTWIAVWESRHDIRNSIGTDKDILCAVSTDSGTTWTDPTWLNTNAETDAGGDARPDIVYNPDFDNWMVGWHSNDSLGDTIGTDWDIVYATSADDGATWTAPTHIDANATSDSGRDLNVDLENEEGNDTLAVWQSNDSRGGAIGTDWDIIGASNVTSGGIPAGAWSDVGPANSDAASDSEHDRNPNGAAPSGGSWHVVWERETAPGMQGIYTTQTTTDGSLGSWQALQVLSATSRRNQRFPVVAVDKGSTTANSDHLITVWQTQRGDDQDIQYSVTTNGTSLPPTWSSRKILNTNARDDDGDDRGPRIVSDGLGRWLCVWHSQHDLRGKAGKDWDLFWSRSTDVGGSWSGPRTLNSDADSDSRSDRRAALVNGLSIGGGLGANTDFATGTTPTTVALADLNGDSAPDAVVTNFNADTISVLLGDGTGGFGAKTDFATGVEPRAVALADLNGDGAPDAVVANDGAGTISVLLGDGIGGFGAKTDFLTDSSPNAIVLADLNADGDLDAVTGNSLPNTISVLLGDGIGGFGANTDFVTGSLPFALALADLNGDGAPDAVTANAGADTISVLLGDGIGGFGVKTDFATGTKPVFVAFADLNGDSAPDAVVANETDDTLSVLLGDGLGGLGAKTDFATGNGPLSVVLADMDRDGVPDAVTANFVTDTISVLAGDGIGGFGAKTDFVTDIRPVSVALADLNGDSAPDAVTANTGRDTISVLLSESVRKWLTVWHSDEARDGADTDNDIFVVRTTNPLNDTL